MVVLVDVLVDVVASKQSQILDDKYKWLVVLVDAESPRKAAPSPAPTTQQRRRAYPVQKTIHRSRYKISCSKNNSLFTDQDTKHKMSTIYPQNITLDSYLPKEKKYPQHICKRFCQFPLALLINFPFNCQCTIHSNL